jgi:predicted nucleic acid-binding protein
VQPYRDQKDKLAHKIFALASTYPKLEWVPLTMHLVDRAAELRVRYRLSTPDAIQLATAIGHHAVCLYGNDHGLRRVKEMECILIDDLVSLAPDRYSEWSLLQMRRKSLSWWES